MWLWKLLSSGMCSHKASQTPFLRLQWLLKIVNSHAIHVENTNMSTENSHVESVSYTCNWNTGRFIMFSVITNIYNKKTKGPTSMDFLHLQENWKSFFWQLEMFDVCSIGCHTRWRVCGNNLNIVAMCAVSPVVHTSNISSCQKKFFSVFLWL